MVKVHLLGEAVDCKSVTDEMRSKGGRQREAL